jgi:competence protein ComEC
VENLRKNFRFYVVGIFFLATVFIWYAVIREDRRGELKIAVLDIGQGDAIYIEAPNGNQVLVDGGPGKILLSALGKVMPFYDRSIDAIVVTHPDQDHIAGFIDLLKSYKVGAVFEPGTKSKTNVYQTFESTVEAKNVKTFLARRGMKIILDKEVSLEILFPDRDVSGLATNEGSIIARLVYGKSSVMLTGDAPEGVESYLVYLDGKGLKSDVLKVGHHGSKISSSAPFLGFVSPKYAAISVGADNKYGHPTAETLDRLSQFGVETGRTDKNGTLVYVSKGESFELER